MGLLRRALLEVGRRARRPGRAARRTSTRVELDARRDRGSPRRRVRPLVPMRWPRADVPAPRHLRRRPAVRRSGSRSIRPGPVTRSRRRSPPLTDMADDRRQPPGARGAVDARAAGALAAGLGVGTDAVRRAGRAWPTRPRRRSPTSSPTTCSSFPSRRRPTTPCSAIGGGLVTEEGGALAHAAVLARELDLPAVIGVAGALGLDHRRRARVEVDPVAGTVRLVR